MGEDEMGHIPKKINELLGTYFDSLELKAPNLLEGYYLYGSASLGAFKYGVSDIDFIAVINRKLTDIDVNILKEIHKNMQRKYPKASLDGFYITENDLVSLNSGSISGVYFNDGKFNGYKEFCKNSIDAYQLKKYGITIKGQNIEEHFYSIDWNILINNMKNNLNTYWFGWWIGCKKFPSFNYIGLLFSIHMVEWGVLGVSRLYYTFNEKDITSKVGAGEYALKVVPQRWHKIINESLRLRNGNKKSLYKSVFKRRKDALDYIEFMIKNCNNLFQ
ncbi:aminoglycoside adenylyltransferase domain-containing protein [Rossellomorea oryzaecorticis]|uniref:Aminoglycoside adenylyltransferase domain-containing protein n=1 Tax=Rossellomorea oryzaecorticis TaxID=1396505 RepID=A0ABU9K559_9BACI